MNNYKIRVNNEAESREAQELFFELGAKWRDAVDSKSIIDSSLDYPFLVVVNEGFLYLTTNLYEQKEELTLPQLRDLVVKHRKQTGLISGADALRALADGEEVEVRKHKEWNSCDIAKATAVDYFINDYYEFRLKPRTIKLEIEVPAPFEPKYGDDVFVIDSSTKDGWTSFVYQKSMAQKIIYGAWRKEAEIKIVVEQLRKLKEHSK